MDPRQIEEDRKASLAFSGMEPCTFDGTQGAAALAEWLHDMETIFSLCHIGVHLQVMLASRRLVGEARIWWLSLGDPEIPRNALHILRDGLSPEVRQFTPLRTIEMTLDEMINTIIEAKIIAYMLQAAAPENDQRFIPIDDASIGEPGFHNGPFMLEEPIPVVPIQAIPPQEEDADADAEMDPANPREAPEDPPVIIIASDDRKRLRRSEVLEEDPEEILFDDEDWDADSEIFSDVMTE
ncbi:hypothetical protein TIFTF001_027787 [Ficus carica]|uniref:Retrotransposon gag domain-containing protein n=1 Tax=Ficus carica TaxID=3494 RepID=A0AA88IVL9_FICCA|nr:hypothetical protein TIFTF001_027787 [Ficus carica]